MTGEVHDPCIGICRFHKRTGLCMGCMRTRREKKVWRRMDAEERRAIHRLIQLRRSGRLEAWPQLPGLRRGHAPRP